MVKYPIGIQTFSEIRKGGWLYVDKTQRVYELANSLKYVFLSRPRRFGKSLLVSTLRSYFEGRRDLFEGLAMERLEKDWEQYPVLQLSLSTAKLGTVEDLNENVGLQLSRYEEDYGIEKDVEGLGPRLNNLVVKIYKKTGKQVVVLIDEYDAPLLTVLHDPERLELMRTALQSFYAPLKDLDPYFRFVFITGITKFSQLSIFSQLNNLAKISMLPQYADICGITQAELEANFTEGIEGLVNTYSLSREAMLEKLRRMYDGYHFANRSEGVYNPFSLLTAMAFGQIDSYWYASGTPTFLIKQIQKFHTDITQIDGSETTASEFDAPTEGMHSILPLFYQSGYLTIKKYDPAFKTYTLGYPNDEVRVGVVDMLVPYYVTPDKNSSYTACRHICGGLMNGNVDEALEAAKAFFASIPYQEGTLKNATTSEGHFTAMLYLMFSLLNMYVFSQVRVAKGRLDILIKTGDYVYVIELKLDGSAEEALRQIDEKGYALPYETEGKKVLRVGVNFSSEERTISNWVWKQA